MKSRSPTEPEACWSEYDMADGEKVRAQVVIFRTRGCSWVKQGGGCTMCGYRNASMRVDVEDLEKQIDYALSKYNGEKFAKFYTSGSFFDENEISKSIRDRLFEEYSECERILVESRPEYITDDVLASLPSKTTIALGLESSNEDVLSRCVHKGFTAAEAAEAGRRIKDAGLKVRTYLLLKPPFLTESDAIDDAVSSARFADGFSDEISINPVNVQHGTDVESLWMKGEYRSPWIWSLIEVLKELSGTVSARLMSSPSGGGSNRGVHNCGKCDRAALNAIERFSFSQNPADLNGVSCECKSSWSRYLEAEKMLGTAASVDPKEDELNIKVM